MVWFMLYHILLLVIHIVHQNLAAFVPHVTRVQGANNGCFHLDQAACYGCIQRTTHTKMFISSSSHLPFSSPEKFRRYSSFHHISPMFIYIDIKKREKVSYRCNPRLILEYIQIFFIRLKKKSRIQISLTKKGKIHLDSILVCFGNQVAWE